MALPLSFSVSEGPEFRRLDPARLAVALVAAMNQSVLLVKRRALLNLTGRFLKVRTGRGRASVATRVGTEGSGVIGVVGTNVFSLRLHEFGVPHPWTIFPRRRKALRFLVGGQVVFARKVTHPGLKERPWLRTALAESRADILRAFEGELTKALKGP